MDLTDYMKEGRRNYEPQGSTRKHQGNPHGHFDNIVKDHRPARVLGQNLPKGFYDGRNEGRNYGRHELWGYFWGISKKVKSATMRIYIIINVNSIPGIAPKRKKGKVMKIIALVNNKGVGKTTSAVR